MAGWFAYLWLASCAVGQEAAPAVRGPLQPQEALKQFQLHPALSIELVASEPQVVDPVAVRFDASGRMWVVEMGDYPHGPAEGEPPKSRIKLLEDTDGNGTFETAHVFADGLLFCTGVQPWRDGVIATMAGQVAYLADTDGDLRADVRETWYSGFAEENSQLRANHPQLGLDHHVYVANGLRGGSVTDPRREGAEVVNLSGKDFRFHPVTFAYEALSGVGQFGLTFDDFGNRFICSNRNPLMHVVIEEQDLRKNPAYAPPKTTHDVARSGAESRLFPISRAWTTSNLHAGQFTAACGVLIFRGAGLPSEFYGNGFTCDPTGNLVHREVLRPEGATFTAQPAREGVEFLASPDEWFRPVNLANGPDGALYVVDMYRAVIEHPQFMPAELKERPDLLLGTDRGRIYRVRTRGEIGDHGPFPAQPSVSELVAALGHPNGWQRDTAARLLFERQDQTAVEPLRQTAHTHELAEARVLALWALQGLEALREDDLWTALVDQHPRVREQAVRLVKVVGAGNRLLEEMVRALAEDADPRVRLAVALHLAPVGHPAGADALGRLSAFGQVDSWIASGVAIASGELPADTLRALMHHAQERAVQDEQRAALVATLVGLAGHRSDAQALAALKHVLAQPGSDPAAARVQQQSLVALVRGLGRRSQSLAKLLEQADAQTAQQVQTLFDQSAAMAARRDASPAARLEAIGVVALNPEARAVLEELALHETQQPVRVRALQALSALADTASLEPWSTLLRGFPAESPALRRVVIDALLARPARTELLLDALASGHLHAGELDPSQSSRLLKHRDAELRKRAAEVLASAVPADRQQVLAEYQQVLSLKGEPQRGKEVFAKNCATCHRIGDVGTNVAPDISDSRTRLPEQLLADILQPNRAIDNNYISYSVLTVDGLTHTGILSSETATSITLRQPEGKEVTLSRDEVEELRSNGVSLMPEGLEKQIPPQAMSDLIAYIKHWRYLDGQTPLGETGP